MFQHNSYWCYISSSGEALWSALRNDCIPSKSFVPGVGGSERRSQPGVVHRGPQHRRAETEAKVPLLAHTKQQLQVLPRFIAAIHLFVIPQYHGSNQELVIFLSTYHKNMYLCVLLRPCLLKRGWFFIVISVPHKKSWTRSSF